jgi:branched-chain amino acid transport system substrate-binding protein
VGRRQFLQAAGTSAALASVAGCLSDEGGGQVEGIPDEIKIGVLAPEPESNPIGASIANGARLAATKIEESDDLLSAASSIEVSVKNTGENPQTGREEYEVLTVEEGSHMTTGVFTSEVLLQLMDSIAQQQTVHMTTGAATPRASGQVKDEYDKKKYHFRTGPINGYHLGVNMVDFLEDQADVLGWDSIALLVEGYEWTNPLEDGIDDNLDRVDVDVEMRRRYASGTENFGPIYDDVEDAGVDAAFIAMAHTGTAAAVQWAQDRRGFEFGGIHVPSQLPAYWQLTEGATAYIVSQNSATPQSEVTDKTVPFSDRFFSEYDSYPVYTGYITHDAVMQWANVVTELETANSDEVVSGLEDDSYNGTVGTVEYYGPDHEYAHDVKYDRDLVYPVYQQWQPGEDGGGVQEVIHPNDLKTADYQKPPWV